MKRLQELRKENGETRMLWHHDYWDGPQSGVMLWNGEKVWFEMFEEKWEERLIPDKDWEEWIEYYKTKNGVEPDEEDRMEYDRYRYFRVYRLPEETMTAIAHNHELFRKFVGVHTDYEEDGSRYLGPGYLKPSSEHKKFYNPGNWLTKLFPRFFKKEKQDEQIKYEFDLSKYEVIGEFEN